MINTNMAALNFPSSPSAGTQYTDDNSAVWEFDGVKWNIVTNATKRFFNGAKVTTSAAISLTATPAATVFDTETFDTGNYFTVAEGSKLTVTETAYYSVNGTFFTGPNGSGDSYSATLRKNGTTDLTTETFAANQSAFYDNIIQLNAGDYLEIYSSESTATGTLLVGSYVEIQKLGTTPAAGVSPFNNFSGARLVTSSPVALTSTPAGVAWTGTTFDLNADVSGNTYWTVSTASRLTVKQTGYFKIKTLLYTGTSGTGDSYTIALRKNGNVNLANTTVSASATLLINETFNLTQNDYIEIVASESGAVGTLTTDSYIEITRLGV